MSKVILDRKITNLSSAVTLVNGMSSVKSQGVTIVNPGTGYREGDLLTVSGGTATKATVSVAKLRVLQVNALGGITQVAVAEGGQLGGSYTSKPSNPVSHTGGTGTGATFNLTWADNIAPPDCSYAVVQAISQDVRYRPDGSTPTATTGEQIKADDSVILDRAALNNALFIEETASANINVIFYKA